MAKNMTRRAFPRGGVRTRLPVTIYRRSFSPTDISGLALWLDASDGATLFQNSDGTVPATASSDPVGYWGDKSGNGRHAVQATAGSRPLVGTAVTNGRRGVNFGTTANSQKLAYVPSSGTQDWQEVFAVGIYDTAASTFADNHTLFGGTTSGLNDIGWQGEQSTNGVSYIYGTFARRSNVNAIDAVDNVFVKPFPSITSPFLLVTRNTNNTLANGFQVGNDRTVANRNWRGRVCEVVAFSRTLTSAERSRVARYFAAKYGITLAPTVSNADAQDWINRVYANGGTVSSATAAAVNTFCNDIDAASLRAAMYRTNLFCGGNLNAALVPLYRGPSLGGTQYGNTTDTNVGGLFVSGDYAETGASGGLNNAARTKHLDTGFATNTLSVGNRHLSAYARTWPNAAYDDFLGSENPLLQNQFCLGHQTAADAVSFAFGSNTARIISGVISSGANWLGVESSTASGVIYRNGVSAVSGSLTTASPTSASIFVFALNRASTPEATDFFGGTLGGYSIGLSMTAPQAAAYNTAMQSFQTALTRNV